MAQALPADRKTAGFSPRAAAVGALTAVLDEHRSLDATLERDAAFAALEPRDRALARAITGTALRRLGTIDAILAKLIAKPPAKAGAFTRILQAAAAQLLFMEVADHAAVSVAVDQITAERKAAHLKGLANAVLRRITRERDQLLAESEMPGCDAPAWLWSRWVKTYGEAMAAGIAAAHRLEPSLDVSVKGDAEGWAEKLGGIVLPTGSVRLIPSGPVDQLAGFAEGAWWVQDAAAALPARLLGDVAGKRVADLCAAPGGKTAALAAAGANVTAVDIADDRVARIRENLARLRLTADAVTADVLHWQPRELFDAVLLDAPCTATGTIRRHPDVPFLKRASDIAELAALQGKMLERAAAFLKPGGALVFCTCSLEPEEGEAHVASALKLGLALQPVTAEEIGGLGEPITPQGCVRTLPVHLSHVTPRLSGLDGFFMMRLKKA